MIGIWHGLVIDCADPRTLADFYQRLLDYIRLDDTDDWVTIGKSIDHPGIAFQRVAGYRPPTWPNSETPTQMHIDVRVDDLAAAREAAEQIGARLLRAESEVFWVMADPEGHPFCLVKL